MAAQSRPSRMGAAAQGDPEDRSERARMPVSEDRRGQRGDVVPGVTDRKSGGACPIGAPTRREGGWNPEGSVQNER
jgi:hypothetical protein